MIQSNHTKTTVTFRADSGLQDFRRIPGISFVCGGCSSLL
jgi:hypothetical protein